MTTRTIAQPTRRSALRGRELRRPAGTGTAARQVLAFAAIGAVSTIAYVVLYAPLRGASPGPVANALALVVTALANTAANRRLTFGLRGRDRLAHDHAAGLLAFAAALAITSASLAILDRAAPNPGRLAEISVLVAANGLATLVRFLILRRALDRGGRRHPAASTDRPITRTSGLEGTHR